MIKGERMVFISDDGEETVFYVQETTTLRGVSYLLVTETEDLESDAYIMRQAEETEDEITYDMVDDDDELQALADIFEELIAAEEEEEEDS